MKNEIKKVATLLYFGFFLSHSGHATAQEPTTQVFDPILHASIFDRSVYLTIFDDTEVTDKLLLNEHRCSGFKIGPHLVLANGYCFYLLTKEYMKNPNATGIIALSGHYDESTSPKTPAMQNTAVAYAKYHEQMFKNYESDETIDQPGDNNLVLIWTVDELKGNFYKLPIPDAPLPENLKVSTNFIHQLTVNLGSRPALIEEEFANYFTFSFDTEAESFNCQNEHWDFLGISAVLETSAPSDPVLYGIFSGWVRDSNRCIAMKISSYTDWIDESVKKIDGWFRVLSPILMPKSE